MTCPPISNASLCAASQLKSRLEPERKHGDVDPRRGLGWFFDTLEAAGAKVLRHVTRRAQEACKTIRNCAPGAHTTDGP